MKRIVLMVATLMVAKTTFAETTFNCTKAALDVVEYVDKLGWGQNPNEPLTVHLEFQDLANKEQTTISSRVSGYYYFVDTYYDVKTGNCVILGISTSPSQMLKK